MADTNLRFSYQDGHVAAWLNDNSPARKRQAAAAVLEMPGVIASYRLKTPRTANGFDRNARDAERRWFCSTAASS